MHNKSGKHKLETRVSTRLAVLALALLIALAACGPSPEQLAAVDYTPQTEGEWEISTPQAQGLDADAVAELYYNASELETIYSLLVFKNGYLVAEDYYHGGSIDKAVNLHSVTKSITSALVGIALEEGCLSSLDERMMQFFPEFAMRVKDQRKREITVREMLQMRAGYPWEESNAELFDLLYHGFRPSNLIDVPLVRDPGSDFDYSNLTAHLLGLVVARACDTDLEIYAQQNLFDPLGIEPEFWQVDWEGNTLGYSDIHLSPRDAAKFGLMYQNDGVYKGEQIVPVEWVHDSLKIYSQNAWKIRVGRNWNDNGYGYQWWSVRAGDYRYNLAWGHGGQQIAILDELDMVVIVLADPLHLEWGDEPWRLEKANLNLVADFVASLPAD